VNATRNGSLERATFTTSRVLEHFSLKELNMQVGHEPELWPIALLKELLDNACDACETARVPPAVRVTVEPDAVVVQDNGPGLPPDVLVKSLDYLVRVSDKSHYASPTRGQLGNALKCVWAAPYVVDGEHGRVEVVTGQKRHVIDVSLDRIAQEPRLEHSVQKDGVVKNGTLIKMHWPGIAGYLDGEKGHAFYKTDRLLTAYALLNPHARLELKAGRRRTVWEPTVPAWAKWLPSWPTSPHWYTAERLRGLIAAYIGQERATARAKTAREFVSEFHGLTSSVRQKAVLTEAGLSGQRLRKLVSGNDVDMEAVERLLQAMTAAARPVKPKALGVIGEAHLTTSLVRHLGIDLDSARYRRVVGEQEGLPFVLEAAFGVRAERGDHDRVLIAGVNWSPVLDCPFRALPDLLGEMRVHDFDPVAVVVHLACPRPEFTDRGKGVLILSLAMREALAKCVRTLTQPWRDAKRDADREGRMRERTLERMRKARQVKPLSLRAAAYRVMSEAYLHASGNGTLPANARQIMYAARPRVLELTGGRCWKKSSYFTQTLLPDFVETHPEVVANWDVVYDARGHLAEPHTGVRIDLGTLAVRGYVGSWTDSCEEKVEAVSLDHDYPTYGPANRYRFALFVEKEGFDSLLERAQIATRFDVAIMSTKGMSVTAARKLVDDLSQQEVTILVLRDFDKPGFSIVHTLGTDSRRYKFRSKPNIIDIGLRLEDVRNLRLDSEPVNYLDKKDPRERLRECGATDEECDFLVDEQTASGWSGQRVELNAMTSPQFIDNLEGKLTELGAKKLVPDEEVLESAYRRAWWHAKLQQAIDRAVDAQDESEVPDPPSDLAEQIGQAIDGKSKPWDEALWEIVRREVAAADDSSSEVPRR
jgi:DNA topoisomerase VI subunit B